ncbi:MAG: alpha/beta hydrolase [Mycobacteriaceae bacterium]|uniref:alpha/beta hydrolase n=1 Tax=Corynebacterium sp. TaxID=1720 RepID=UPI003F9B1889
MNKRATSRVAAAAIATALPLSMLSVAPAMAGVAQPDVAEVQDGNVQAEAGDSIVSDPFKNIGEAEKAGYVPEDDSSWRNFVYQENGERYNRMEERKVTSPAMGDREIPVVTIRAKDNAENAPTIYLLNGADGGEGIANWLQQTNAIDFYGNQIGNVNVVIPMAGGFSYYTDWEQPNAALDTDGNGKGGKQMWETLLTKELPGPMETALGAANPGAQDGKRGLIGMSMTASTSLVYAQQNPGFYDSIASYSGCAQTSRELEPTVQIVLDRAPAQYEEMWGDPYGETALRNDALHNAGKLKGQNNIYVSNGSGLMGEHDLASGDRLNGNIIGSITPGVEGGAIEGVSNVCTHMLQSTMKDEGIDFGANNVDFNFRNTGTHQWGYWQDDMFESWPVISEGIFPNSTGAAQQQTEAAKAAYLKENPGGGDAGSTPVSSLELPSADNVRRAAEEEGVENAG